MATWHDDVLDGSLDIIVNNADRITICAGEPTTYADATTAPETGKMLAAMTLAGGDFTKAAGDVDGRKLTIAEKTDNDAVASGTASHVALVDDANSKLLSVTSLSSSQSVTAGNSVTIAAQVFTNRQLTVAS